MKKLILISVVSTFFGVVTPASAEQKQNMIDSVQPAEKVVVEISEQGATPHKVILTKVDSSVFFLNTSTDSLMSLKVLFAGKKMHCASENVKVTPAGDLETIVPIAPKDFALMCFPERGTYPVEIRGLGDKLVTAEVVAAVDATKETLP